MAIDEELRPMHGLTELGKDSYEKMLEQRADEILFMNEHPFRWMLREIKSWFKED